MTPRILLCADQLDRANIERVARACAGWARFEHVLQTTADADMRRILDRTDAAVGWVPPQMLCPGSVSTYLCGSAGYDAYVGLGLDKKQGFRLTNAAGLMTTPIAEHCMALLLALVRQIPLILDQQRRRHYERRYDAGEILGATACIVGMGGVGRELAKRLRAFGVRTLAVCRNPVANAGHADETLPMESLRAALGRADHVFVVIAGGPDTRWLMNRETFAAMKPGALFFTAARGSVTNQDDLCEALRSGRLGGAGVDVFAREPLDPDSPLWTLPNVIVSPHSAGLSNRLNRKLTDLFVANLENLRDGKPLINQVSPECLA